MFNEKIIEVFNNPQNVGVLHGHNAQGTTTNEITNEIIRMYLLIENDKVADVKFKAFGGVECIAFTSVACDLIKNKSIDKLSTIDVKDFQKIFGEFDVNAKLVIEQIKQTLDLAVKDYYKKLEKEASK